MEWNNYALWVWVVSMGLVIVAVIVRIIAWVRREGEWSIRVGGHHDPVTGEFHGITHYFDREAVLTWYADCPKCIAARNRWSVSDDFGWDPYAFVRGDQSIPEPESDVLDKSKKGVLS